METAVKHFKFINSRTGNTLYYYSVDKKLPIEQVQKQLGVIKDEVALSNGVFAGTIYWEEVKE